MASTAPATPPCAVITMTEVAPGNAFSRSKFSAEAVRQIHVQQGKIKLTISQQSPGGGEGISGRDLGTLPLQLCGQLAAQQRFVLHQQQA